MLSLGGANLASGTPITFSGSSGSRSASVTFDVSGSVLEVTLSNTSVADVLVPVDVLTAVFFTLAGNPPLTRLSATVCEGCVLFGGTDAGGGVGGEWAYETGLVGAPLGANQGISGSGFGLFGPPDRFPGNNLQGPDSPDGLQYGITSAGDNPGTGNTPVTGTNALIQNSVFFTLGDLPEGFKLEEISHVSFQYGTALDEPNVPGIQQVPEPAVLFLLASGLTGLGLWRRAFCLVTKK